MTTTVAMFHNNKLTQDLGQWLTNAAMNTDNSSTNVLQNLIVFSYFGNEYIYGTFPDNIALNFSSMKLYGGSDSDIYGSLPSQMTFSNPGMQALMVCSYTHTYICFELFVK